MKACNLPMLMAVMAATMLFFAGDQTATAQHICRAEIIPAEPCLQKEEEEKEEEHTHDSSSSSSSSSPSPSSTIDFLSLCHRLKTTKRTGWLRNEVQEPESIADHMYRMGLMALIASDIPAGVNREKCIKMAIVHDIAEAIVGDINPYDGVAKEEKSRREREALKKMLELLGGGERAKEMWDLWMEYEENSSMEAKVVKDLDKVELILQALEYESEQGKDLQDFFETTAGKFQTDLGKAWAKEVASRRRK